LHVAGSTLTHQRVIECFLSGGLCLCRLHREIISSARLNTQLALLARRPDVIEADRIGYTVADHPEAMALANMLAAVGYPYVDGTLRIPKARAESHRAFRQVLAPDTDPTFLLRDLSETTFSTKAQLESLVQRAIDNPAWRSAVSSMVAKQARAYLTHDALITRTLNLIQASLASAAAKEAA